MIAFTLFFFMMLMLALNTVPYNQDSLIYHLTRLFYWKQNASVAHYATNDIRQIASPPLSEFIDLQIYLFTGKNDECLNLLQFFSYLTNTILIAGICRKLGGNYKSSVVACLLYISMPIAFAEALSTQVDEFTTMWILMFVYLLLDLTDRKSNLKLDQFTWAHIVGLACCVGLGYLAKPYVLLVMLVMLIWLLVVCIERKDKMAVIIPLLLVAGGIVSLIILPEILRNIHTFSALLASGTGERQLIGTINPRYVFVNGIKNFVLNLPNIYIYQGTDILEHSVYWIAYMLRVSIDDPTISEDGRPYVLNRVQDYGHDTAINPVLAISFLLLLVYLIVKLIRKRRKKAASIVTDMRVQSFSWCAVISFLLCCGMIRWESYVNRYMLGYFALLCPVIALQLETLALTNRKIAQVIMTLLCFMSFVELGGLIGYHSRIIKEQAALGHHSADYFVGCGGEIEQYLPLADAINAKQYKSIGFWGYNAFEFPLWQMLDYNPVVKAIMVDNESAIYEDSEYIPECLVVIGAESGMLEVEYHGMSYAVTTEVSDGVVIMELK